MRDQAGADGDPPPTDRAWFERQSPDSGASWPIAPQGWRLMIGFTLALLLLSPLIAVSVPAYVALLAVSLALFILIVQNKTRGAPRGGDKE